MIRILLISVLLFLTGFHANAQFVGEVHISEFKILILQKRRIIPPATADNGHFLYASAGIGHIVSKVYSDWTSGDARLGPDWCAGYDWIGKKRFGAGLLYSGFTSTGKTNTTYGNFKQRFLLNYIAPQFAYRIRQSKWAFGGRAGIGLAIYTDRITGDCSPCDDRSLSRKTVCGFGYNVGIFAEYEIAGKLWFSCGLNFLDNYVRQDKDKFGIPENGNGFKRLGLDLGIRFQL
ncbi:hypothetical protein EEL33_14705 [Muribaculaceae bacterium Isolate-037 (Harlan)]|jgi:hypothetical protein|nr:hypothetical protein EEL33_14705 [Muribaculaceae bacterium Isolate-037 (Harlan)]